MYSQDLQPVTSHRGDYGYLIAVISGDRAVYSKETSKYLNHVLDVYSLASHVSRQLSLKPPGSRHWGWLLSVSADELTGRIAVAEYETKSLDLFTATGEGEH